MQVFKKDKTLRIKNLMVAIMSVLLVLTLVTTISLGVCMEVMAEGEDDKKDDKQTEQTTEDGKTDKESSGDESSDKKDDKKDGEEKKDEETKEDGEAASEETSEDQQEEPAEVDPGDIGLDLNPVMPEVTSDSYIVLSGSTSEVVLEKHSTRKMSPGRITMLVTAMVVIDNMYDANELNNTVEITEKLAKYGDDFKEGESVSVGDLLNAMLVGGSE